MNNSGTECLSTASAPIQVHRRTAGTGATIPSSIETVAGVSNHGAHRRSHDPGKRVNTISERLLVWFQLNHRAIENLGMGPRETISILKPIISVISTIKTAPSRLQERSQPIRTMGGFHADLFLKISYARLCVRGREQWATLKTVSRQK